MGEIVEVQYWRLLRAIEGGGAIQVTARLPVTKSEDGQRFIIDIEGQDDMIVGGDTVGEVVEVALEALRADVDYAIEHNTRQAL